MGSGVYSLGFIGCSGFRASRVLPMQARLRMVVQAVIHPAGTRVTVGTPWAKQICCRILAKARPLTLKLLRTSARTLPTAR